MSSDYKIRLRAIAQMIKVQRTLRNGQPDILTGMHGSAFSGDLKEWRFDGMKYHHVACASYDSTDGGGNELKQPRITPQPCNPR